MPRKPKPSGDPLAEIRNRIREAEKNQAPVIREAIGMSRESFELLAELVERGMGKKPDVLRQALASGLRVLKAGIEEVRDDVIVPASADWHWLSHGVEPPEPSGELPVAPGLVSGALGLSLPITAPTDTPPSHDRDESEEDSDE